MINYVTISLFDSPAQTLVNTVNTVGVMGKGIAAVFKKLYPDMYQRYHQICQEGKLDTGMLYIYHTENKIIVNFPTKKHWRHPSRLEYIEKGLEKFIAHYVEYGISSVSFPQLGCGHGELDWKQVRPLMEHFLGDLPIPVYVHLYSKSPDFVPERLDADYIHQVQIERQRISVARLWQDIYDSVLAMPQLDMFGPVIEMNDRQILFKTGETTTPPVIIHREDIEDIWNTLRLRGMIQESDIPPSFRNSQEGWWLFDLLQRANYIQPITLYTENRQVGRCLRYVPPPQKSPSKVDTLT